MATDGGSGEEERRSPGGDAEEKKEFDVDTLSKPELRFLLSIMEGELEARDLVIEALRARRKEVFVQERYGRFNLSDPFLALQRDYEAGTGGRERKAICTNPLTILEAIMAHCRKMQERMTAQLAAAESRQRKLELEKCELQNTEQEHKKLSVRLEEERAKNKHVVLTLVKECKQLSSKMIEESQKLEEVMSKFEAEKKKTLELEEALAVEKQRSTQLEAQMEAQMEKQLSEFDTEREKLRARLGREEAHTSDLKQQIDKMKKTIEEMKKENNRKPNASLPRRSEDKHFVSVGVSLDEITQCSIACQTDMMVDLASESIKKLPLTVPVKPSTGSPLITGNSKMTVCSNSAFVKPSIEKQIIYNDLLITPPITHVITSAQSKIEENGPSTGSSPDLTNNTSLCPNSTISGSPASPNYLSSSLHSLHSHPNLSPRVQAARFRFQTNANDPDQNGNTTQSPPARELSSTSRDSLVAKQLARNTVTQVLSRFTTPQGGSNLRQGMLHSMEVGTYPPLVGRIGHPAVGLKPSTVSKIDRGNPPPIPPKKPGLSQTPSPPHPQLKAIIEGSRPSNIGVKIENKTMTSPPSTSSQGIRVINEEALSKSSSPQLPPKPSIDIPVASAGCVIPAIATSQVGSWPPQSPGLRQYACSKTNSVVSTTIICTSSINPVNASACRPCGSDSLLVTASGWSSSLTPMLMSGGPVPLGGRPTLLHQAAAQGNVTLLSMLLNEEGIDINFSCEDGYSALYSAAENGHTECMRLLLTSGAYVDAADKNGFTALCLAAAQGHFKCTELLLAYDADFNHAAEGGQTPLYLACKNGSNGCTKLLLEAGADRCTVTRDDWTPVHAAVDSGSVDCLKLLMYYGPAEDGNFLCDAELNLDLLDLDGIETNDSHKVQPVVSADLINHADKEGWTAAHIAASKGFKDCLDILCSHSGLDNEQKDKCNRTVHDVATDDCKHLLENLNAIQVLLRISIGETVQICCDTNNFESSDTICALNIRKQMTWDDFSKTVSQALTDHFQVVVSDGWGRHDVLTFNNTAESSLGLSASSVLSIKLGDISWSAGQVYPQSPWDSLKDSGVEEVTVSLLGPQEGFLHSVTYASMIPLPALQNFLRLVEQYRNVIFHGPEGSLQGYMAYQIARCMKQKQESQGFHCEIIRSEINASFSKEQLVELFIDSECLIPVMKQPPVTKKTIVILENLEKASLAELLEDFLAPLDNRGSAHPCTFQRVNGSSDSYYFQENCYLLGTIAKSHLQGSDLLVQQHFRWVQLRWDGEPTHGLLQRFLRKKVLSKFKGKMPPPGDPICKSIDWICAVWHQLNSCLSRLGTPEAFLGPEYFLSCPVVPGHTHVIVKWLSKLWNAIVAPKVQAAVLCRASVRRPAGLGQLATDAPSQGQQAVVKAALSILLNKAVLHGCPLPRSELDQYIGIFKGSNFPVSLISNYNCNKKKGESSSWRKVNTSPRKKSSHVSPSAWNKSEENGVESQNGLQQNYTKLTGQMKLRLIENGQPRSLSMAQRLSLGSDDEDLVRELQSICSSKSEPDISKIADSKDDLTIFSNSQNKPRPSATAVSPKTQVPKQDGVCSFSSSQAMEHNISKSKMDLGISRAKSQLPVPKNKASQSSVNMKRSSSNTRQIETSYSKDENWNLHKNI